MIVQTVKWINLKTDRQRNIKMNGCTFEQMDLRTERHTEKHMKGCKDSQKDGPMDGLTD